MLPNVLIIHPDLALAARLHQLIASGTDVEIGFDDSLAGGLTALEGYSHLELCVCDFHGPDRDVLNFLDKVRGKFPRARLVVTTCRDIDAYKALENVVVLPLPLDEAQFILVCAETFATLEGQEFPPFRLGPKVRSDRSGDWYEAYDTVLKRDTYLTVIHSWATEEESMQFRAAAALMAQASHSHVQAVYLAGEHKGRHFVCHEKWDVPNLADMAAADIRINPRQAAQILHTVGSVLKFWSDEGYPHPAIGPGQITLSPQGVIKVVNCVDPALPVRPLILGDLVAVAEVIQRLLLPGKQVPPSLSRLLDQIVSGEHVALDTTLGEIIFELDRIHSPITVDNFQRYVQAQAYDGSIFHHIIPGFVVQGGRFKTDMLKVPTEAPIPNEATNGQLNLRGTIAMARGSDPDSATSQFAFNLLDNRSLNHSANRPGYAVFGRVIRGMDVVDKIAQVKTSRHGAYHYLPDEQVVVRSARRKDAISVEEVIEEAQALDIQLAPEQDITLASKSIAQQKTTKLSMSP